MRTRSLICVASVVMAFGAASAPSVAMLPPPVDAPDPAISLTGTLRHVNTHYKLVKNGVPHLLDASAVPQRASHLIGRTVHITGHLEDRVVNGVQAEVFVVVSMRLVP